MAHQVQDEVFSQNKPGRHLERESTSRAGRPARTAGGNDPGLQTGARSHEFYERPTVHHRHYRRRFEQKVLASRNVDYVEPVRARRRTCRSSTTAPRSDCARRHGRIAGAVKSARHIDGARAQIDHADKPDGDAGQTPPRCPFPARPLRSAARALCAALPWFGAVLPPKSPKANKDGQSARQHPPQRSPLTSSAFAAGFPDAKRNTLPKRRPSATDCLPPRTIWAPAKPHHADDFSQHCELNASTRKS